MEIFIKLLGIVTCYRAKLLSIDKLELSPPIYYHPIQMLQGRPIKERRTYAGEQVRCAMKNVAVGVMDSFVQKIKTEILAADYGVKGEYM